MSENTHRELRELLGWFAVGRTDPAETVRVQAHLDGCSSCRAELAELRGTLARIERVDPDRIDDTPTPPPHLGDQVIEHVLSSAPERRPRTTSPLLLAAAAVGVLLVGVGAGWLLSPSPVQVAGPPTEPVTVEVVEPTLHASAQLINHTWGVEIQLTADGFNEGEAYRVQMISTSGARTSAGEFVGTGPAPMICNLNSSVLRPQAAGFEILDESGDVLLRSDFA